MRRIALCAVVCLSLFGALAQARINSSSSTSSSTVHPRSTHTSKPHKKAKKHSKKHSKKQTATKLTTTTAKPSIASSGATSTLFGNSAVESGLDSNAAGWAEAFPFTSQTAGKVASISVYVASANKATSLIAGIYSNDNGDPGSLLTSGTLASPKAGAWNRVTVTSTALKSGEYWVALLGRGGALYFNDRSNGPCTSENSSQMSATSLSATWPAGGPTWSSCPLSATVLGTPSAIVASTGGSGSGATATTITAKTTPPPTTTTTTTTTLPTLLPPVNALAPSVSGTGVDGQTLSTSDGTWLDDPSSYAYQWQDCSGSSCANIAGATGSSYKLADGDIGKTVRSVVTASNSAGAASADSAATSAVAAPPAPSNTAAPSISGSAVQGQSLTTTSGSWSGNPTMFSYQWQDCNSSGASCTNISGANGSSYTLGSGDVGHTIRSVVTAGNAGGSSSANSTASAIATAPATPPSNTALPAVSGTTTQGQSLSTSNGSWSGNPSSFSYKWQDCNSSGASCTNISGATGSSYTLGSGDVGHTIRSVVAATNSAGSTSATSAQTPAVASSVTAPSMTAAPTMSGTDTQGSTLTTSNGSWSGGPTSYAYQWQNCNTSGASCTNISGATTSSYTLQGSDVGDTVRSVVTASNSAGSASASSSASSTVAASGGGGGGGGGSGGGGGGGGGSTYTCTQHVTTSTFASAYSSAGAGAVLCLAPGSYGNFNASSKSSMVVITPDTSAGATAPTGNATGDVNGNVTFSGADFSPAANTTMDGITFTGDVSMSGNTHDITLHDSVFHQHLIIDDTSMNNANIVVNYNMFPGDKADCINGPEGRIWPHDSNHSSTPDGVLIENNNIGGATSQCDGIQIGGYGVQVLGNWFHDFHYQNSAHTDGIQDYGGAYELVKGNFMYNVPDCFVSYDGTNHADVEDNICVNDGSQSNGASPNDLDILGDTGSIIKHNTVVAYEDSYNNAGGCITLGAKSGKSSGTVLTDNISTCLTTDSGGVTASYSENHNMWVSSGPSGTGDVHGTPTYTGGGCASLSSSQSPFCADSWSDYLLTSSSVGNNAADDGTDMGAYGSGPVTPGGPA